LFFKIILACVNSAFNALSLDKLRLRGKAKSGPLICEASADPMSLGRR